MKTKGSRRRVPLPARADLALEVVPRRLDTRLVFPGSRGAHIDLRNWRKREWKPALEAAGLPRKRRPYDLRHSYASWALAAGVPAYDVARYMGTSVRMLDLTYGHLVKGWGTLRNPGSTRTRRAPLTRPSMGDCGDGWWNLVNLVAALAALAAVWFAYRASKETRDLRRADRLAVLADVIGDAGRAAVETARGAAHSHQVVIARTSVESALAASREDLPQSRALVEFLLRGDFGPSDFTEIEAAVQKALAEVSARLGQV